MFVARVFSQKHSSTYVGNGGKYSVGKDRVYQKWQSGKTECFAGVSREGLTHETLAKTSCLHPVLTLRIPVMCRAHASLREKLTHEIPTKTILVFNSLESSHSFSLTHTTLTNKTHMKYMVHKIEHNYNQIWHNKSQQIHSCKLQLYTKNPSWGKLGPNWEGSYHITSMAEIGAYFLEDLDENVVPCPWNVNNFRMYYY